MSIYVGILISYIAGSLIYIFTDIGFAVVFSFVFFFVNLTLALFNKLPKRRITYAFALLLGACLLAGASEPSISEFDNYLNKYIEIEGVISEIPDRREEHYSYVLTANRVDYLNKSKDISEKIRVNFEKELRVGNRVKFRGYLSEIMPPDNSTEFDYKRYYISKGIFYTQNAEEAEIVSEKAFLLSPKFVSEYLKGNFANMIDRYFKNDDAAILKAVLLGVRSEFSDDFRDVLVKTSAMRFLYPSFLHLYLLMSLVGVLFENVTYKMRTRLTVIALVAFCLFNGSLITFIRAGVFTLITLLYKKYRGFSHYPDVFSITVTGCLIANPLLYYNSGFVMSVVTGVLLYHFRLPVASSLKYITNRKMKTTVSIWIVATVGLIPFGGYFFGGMPLYSIIFTVIYMPLTLIALFLTPIALLFYSILGLDHSVGIILNGVLTLMKNVPEMVSYLPWHYVVIPKTGLLGFLVFSLVVCLIKELLSERIEKWKINITAIPLLVIMIVSAAINISDIGNMYVTFINVGQGDGAMIEVKGKDTILIDGGGTTTDADYDIGREVFLPYLTAKGKDKIDLAVVSHFHTDHTDGIIAAIESLRVHTLLMPYSPLDIKARDELLEICEKVGTNVIEASKGDRIEFDSGLLIEVLSPYKNSNYEDNDLSLVLKISYGEADMIFTGDITSFAESNLAGKLGKCDVVKVAHHGSKNSSTKEFIEETSPKFAVVSAGRNNIYGHPADRVVKDYSAAGSEILRTDYMCDITLKCTKDGKIGAGWFGEVLKWQ